MYHQPKKKRSRQPTGRPTGRPRTLESDNVTVGVRVSATKMEKLCNKLGYLTYSDAVRAAVDLLTADTVTTEHTPAPIPAA